jgi:hypothetical protein
MSRSSRTTPSLRRGEKDYKCRECLKGVTDKDKGVQCEVCEVWFHLQCTDLTEDVYKYMDKVESLHWYCSVCNKGIGSLIVSLKAMEERHGKLEKKVDGIAEALAKLEAGMVSVQVIHKEVVNIKEHMNVLSKVEEKVDERIKKYEIEFPTLAEVATKTVENKMEQVNKDLSKVQRNLEEAKLSADEERDRERRCNNIIIFKAQESDSITITKDHDRKFVSELIRKQLNIDFQDSEIKACVRLGNKGANDRPLLVQFREKGLKNRVMESLRMLKNGDEKFKNLSITHEMTRKEREECKRLVEEAKSKQVEGEFKYRVRGSPGNMKIVRIQIMNN